MLTDMVAPTAVGIPSSCWRLHELPSSPLYLLESTFMGLSSDEASVLVGIKLLHTVIWLFFASCIPALPVAGILRRFRCAAILTTLVLMECVVLLFNHFHCPLTDLAARYTRDRSANFDIYLPAWLARNNQTIFGTLFVASVLFVSSKWLSSRRAWSSDSAAKFSHRMHCAANEA